MNPQVIYYVLMALKIVASLKRDGHLDVGSLVDQVLPILMERFGGKLGSEDSQLIKTLIDQLLDNIKD